MPRFQVTALFMDPYRDRLVRLDDDEPVNYVEMAEFEFEAADENEALDLAYLHTNNRADSWSKVIGGRPSHDMHPSLNLLRDLPVVNGRTFGHRSASIGDRFRVNGKLYEVATFGFEAVEETV